MKTIFFVLSVLVLSCNYPDQSHEEKSEIKQDTIEELISEPETEEIVQKGDTGFLTVFSAEVSHQFTFPENLTNLETSRYDSLIYFYPDSSLIIKKWVYHNFLKSFNYPRDEFNDIVIEEIDLNLLWKDFEDRCELEFKNYLGNGDFQKISIDDDTQNQKLLVGEKGGRRVVKKMMLCNVVGGTHAIVMLEIDFSSKMNDFVKIIIDGTHPRFRKNHQKNK